MKKNLGWKAGLAVLPAMAAVILTLLSQDARPREEFFGQDTPGDVAEPFLPDLFSARGIYGFHLHSSLFFAADGRIVYFTNQKVPVVAGHDQEILVIERRDGKYLGPRIVPFSGIYSDQLFHLSPEGGRMYFTSTRPPEGKGDALDSREGWIAERGASDWKGPRRIASPLELTEDDGTLYVSAQWPGGRGGDDVYRLAYGDGHYDSPRNVGPPINTEFDEVACCWPKDERYLIFYRFHPDDRNIRGLYLSFRKGIFSWTEPISVSRMLGIEDAFRATLSPGGKFLFILNRGDGVYWIESRHVENAAIALRTP